MNPRPERILYAVALLLGALPLWLVDRLPMVDLPQHLHLISVLHRLEDPTTLYPDVFGARPGFTPYLGYYWVVSALNWLVPVELANRLFLTACVVGLPLALRALLSSLGRPGWPSLLALPFGYGDNFGWGFVNYLSAIPLALLSCALFVRTLTEPATRRRNALLTAATLLAVLAFHVQGFVFLAVALPALLLTVRTPEDGSRISWSSRGWALAAVVPAVAVFGSWALGRLGSPPEIEPGAPWKAWGPLLSAENLAFKPLAQNLAELFTLPANLLRDGSDRLPFVLAVLVAIAAVLAPWVWRDARGDRVGPSPQLALLAALALGLYLTLPFDVRGSVYYFNSRFAGLVWPLVLAGLVPVLSPRARRAFVVASTGVALVLGVTLARGLIAFDREADALTRLEPYVAWKPRVMGLIFSPSAAAVTHPVFLHSASELARARGGLTNFSFASTPHSPLMYTVPPPPTFRSEWRPGEFSWERFGAGYDHFLLRGAEPAQVFGEHLGADVRIVAREGDFVLLRRR